MNRSIPTALFAIAVGLVTAGCSDDGGEIGLSGSSGSSQNSASGAGGGGGSGGGGGGQGGAGVGGGMGGAGGDKAQATYPDIATLHDLGVSRTCSLMDGVCHSSKQYPDLKFAKQFLDLIGAPCQLGAADPAKTPDECEVPGDMLVLAGVDYEILRVLVSPTAPFPPTSVELKLAAAPPALDNNGARIRRVDGNAMEVLSKPLDGVVLTPGSDAQSVTLGLTGATTPGLATFMDIRAWTGDRVRMGDPNGNGMAHNSPSPWALIMPGDPARSFLYKRLISDKLGPMMPLIPRTWNPAATRAVWCWIRGLAPDATPATASVYDPIDYDNCPIDPDAPDPNASGGWPSVAALVGNRCATAMCHLEPMPSGELDLAPNADNFLAHVIQAPSKQVTGVLLVVPGQPAASYLLCKVDPACESRAPMTDLMPQTGNPLTVDEIGTISEWILNGAPVE